MIDIPRICPADAGEHCLFGLRGAAEPAVAPADPARRAEWRRRRLAGLAMTEAEWARRYAESQG